MPRFSLRFIGMSLFVRHPQDKKVDVRFVTKAMPPMAHMQPSAVEQHIPILVMSPDSWRRTNDDSGFPGRAPGRPIYLSQYDSVTIWLNGNVLPGGVTVSSGAPIVTKPATVAAWNNFDQLIPKLADLFPGSAYSATLADAVAPNGKMMLTGGTLGTEPPSNPDGEGPWEVIDRATQTASPNLRFVSDVAVYSFDFKNGDSIGLNLNGPLGTTSLAFKADTDINGWVAHEPFLAVLTRVPTREILHLHVAGAFVDPAPDPLRLPPIFRLPTTAVLLHPDDYSCPPTQVVLGPDYDMRSPGGRRS